MVDQTDRHQGKSSDSGGGPGRQWRPTVTLTLSALGLAISLYTLWVHYHPAALACVSTGAIDCQAVLTSAQSVILGVPIPAFGVLFFLVMGAFCLPVAWRSTTPWVHRARLAAVLVGIGMVCYLVSTELFTVKKICLWCTGVHVVTFALFVIVVTGTPALIARPIDAPEDADGGPRRNR